MRGREGVEQKGMDWGDDSRFVAQSWVRHVCGVWYVGVVGVDVDVWQVWIWICGMEDCIACMCDAMQCSKDHEEIIDFMRNLTWKGNVIWLKSGTQKMSGFDVGVDCMYGLYVVKCVQLNVCS